MPRQDNDTTTGTDRIGLNSREAAALLGISERTLWTEMRAGRVPHVRIGRRVIFPRHLLVRWLDEKAGTKHRR
ncbi:MAG: helix-turn-helix domain-containing protein [bacterium]